jgi:hypothetical protein
VDEGWVTVSSLLSLSSEEERAVFVELPHLSCVGISDAVAIPVEESNSALSQVLLLGGEEPHVGFGTRSVSTVHLVDLATGVCTSAHPDLLHSRCYFAAEQLLDGRIVCVGGSNGDFSSGEVYGPPDLGEPDAAWTWRQLSAMSVGRAEGCRGCVMSDGRFAVLGGFSPGVGFTPSCEALVTTKNDAHWESLPPMHVSRS